MQKSSIVVTPTLIHKDLWDGNIFIDPSTTKVIAVIDFERAIYAGPLLEAVCAFKDDDVHFMMCFYDKDTLTETEKVRIELYKLYLYLIMTIESSFRKYEDTVFVEWSRTKCEEVFVKLF